MTQPEIDQLISLCERLTESLEGYINDSYAVSPDDRGLLIEAKEIIAKHLESKPA